MGKYNLILADPAWKYNDQGTRMSPAYEGHQRKSGKVYDYMELEEICALGEWVKSIAADDAILLLWSTQPLKQTHPWPVIEAWGFHYSTAIPWVKARFDTETGRVIYQQAGGHTVRSVSEELLVCTRGKVSRIRMNKGIPGAIIAPRPKRPKGQLHSSKPDQQFEIGQALVGLDAPKIELFARERRPGWYAWGKQLDIAPEELGLTPPTVPSSQWDEIYREAKSKAIVYGVYGDSPKEEEIA